MNSLCCYNWCPRESEVKVGDVPVCRLHEEASRKLAEEAKKLPRWRTGR